MILKPCPFCGSEDLEYMHGPKGKLGYLTCVVCTTCDARGPNEYEPTTDVAHNADALWNAREDMRYF